MVVYIYFERGNLEMPNSKSRIQVLIDADVVKRIDDYAHISGVSRSAAIAMLCTDSLNQREFMTKFPQLLELYQNELKQERGEK